MLQYGKTRDIKIVAISCDKTKRYLPPTDAAVAAMARSLLKEGQISPILVYHIAGGQYRLVVGATRFMATRELKRDTIRATVITGTAADYEICELAENVERRELTAAQRMEMRARIKELRTQQGRRLAGVEPAVGGRGQTGGLAEAARAEGVPRTTARRLAVEDKPGHSNGIGQVSHPTGDDAPHKFPVPLTEGEFQRLAAWSEKRGVKIGQGARQIIRERLDREQQAAD